MIPDEFINSTFRRISSAADRRFGSAVRRIGQIFFIRLTIRTVREISDDDVSHMAAGVAYYALFSLFPLLLGLIAILSFFLESEDIQTQVVELTGGFLPGSDLFVQDNIDAALGLRGALGLFSVIGMLWSGSAIFGALNRSINRAWDIHTDRPIYKGKPRQLVMALGVGLLFALSFSSATVVRTAESLSQYDVPVLGFLVQQIGQILLQGFSFVLVLMIFLLIYKFMPNTKTYWKYIWPGAVLGAVLFELAKNLFILYLERSTYQNIYGSITPVIVLLLWAYVSSLIVLAGAELSSEYGRMRNNVGRGMLLTADEGVVEPVVAID
ncbi:MAG: YihY/virulence factor BrkB family protein [SAR202 cluster bacterium]|jgi:membrane protein|nr:YihY/virulence factor BrkB family protein [SAR202 cluster bacterium]MDP6511974.1 YihY/virulence factor BrkB family protein [SAR202 cluster bacterium]